MSVPTAEQCLKAMKMLETKNAKLQAKIKEQTESEINLKNELSQLQKKYNDLVSKEVTISSSDQSESMCAPSASYDTIQQLTTQIMEMKCQLERQCSTESILDKADFLNAIQNYKEIIKQKNQDIARLQEGCSQAELQRKVSKLTALLQKTKAVNHSYMVEITSLQSKINDLVLEEDIGTTQPQTVSGDQDVHGTSSTSSVLDISGIEKEADKLRTENDQLKQQFVHLSKEKEDLKRKLFETESECDKLRQENARLHHDLSVAKAADTQLIQYQLKTFEDDFNSERKEKEQITGENNRLKQQLHDLQVALGKQHQPGYPHQTYNQPPPRASKPPTPYPFNLQAQRPEWPSYQQPHSISKPLDEYSQSSQNIQENQQNHLQHQKGHTPSHDNSGYQPPYQQPPMEQTRKIGFPGIADQITSAASRSTHQPSSNYTTSHPGSQQRSYQRQYANSGYLQCDNTKEHLQGTSERPESTSKDQN